MTTGIAVGSIIVSLIAALGGWASAKASSRASTTNVVTSSRVEMEKEAYERARALDTETINRQKVELLELREEADEHERDIQQLHYANDRLHQENQMVLADNRRLREELAHLRTRFTRLERGLPTGSTELIREREDDTNPMGDYRDKPGQL
jgi:predicted nuclease with TOPRIM domain